jgi:glycosyltransferase involved in cell wall biosynthesis
MPEIRISVVTVCFNAVATIERTILSVQSQSYPNIEYIVVDGASNDGTLDVANKYADKISRLISEKDEGIFDAMNKGTAIATGEVIYFLNADDCFFDEGVLDDVARAFEEDRSRMLVYGNVILKDGPPGVLNFPARPFQKRSISEFLHNSFCHQAVFVRRTLFARLGPFDLRYKYSADYEWIIRAFKLDSGRDFFFINRNIAYYFFRGRSQQHAGVTWREVHRMQVRHFLSVEYAWYYFRYVFLRKWKKKFLNETY